MESKIDYEKKLQYHYRPKKGWINDPNGLVYFQGYYHVFYQHEPNYEVPGLEPEHWGHARTKDFLHWEELPIALYPDQEYDKDGCWSGTAIVKDDVLYLFYASILQPDCKQTVSIAYSTDGIHFQKYEKNPVIDHYPPEGGKNFRDPAVWEYQGKYYLAMASGNEETKTGRILLYMSDDLFCWEYAGVMQEWANCEFVECPAVVTVGDKLLIAVSVCPIDDARYFQIMLGSFVDRKFKVEYAGNFDKGPDQYAGQLFQDQLGRNIIISWVPGWDYIGYAKKDIGCFSAAREIKIDRGTVTSFPVREYHHLLKDEDPCLKRTEDGFVVERTNREPVTCREEIQDIKILRDEYIAEIYVNHGREVYTILL